VPANIKFGTDGWRAVIAEDYTFDNVRICAQAVADYLKESGLAERGLIIGHDTRFAAEAFAAAAAEVTSASDIKTYLCREAAPTPVVSFGVTAKQAGGAIIITASHNPPQWNGFKLKTETGTSASPEITARLEEHIARLQREGGVKRRPLTPDNDAFEYVDLTPVYDQQITKLVDLDNIRRAGLKIAIDPMFGAGMGYFRRLLGGGASEIIEINSERNPLFPGMKQPEPIAENLTRLVATVRERGAAVGIATDGDADRVGIVAEDGSFISTLHTFTLLCLYLLEVRGERGAIIRTVTMSNMIHRLGELFNVPIYETPVGFKYVAPKMRQENALIGGEESGGYAFQGHVLERDGILAGLYFLDLMVRTGKSPRELIEYLHSKVGPHYYQRHDIKITGDKAAIIERVKNHAPEEIAGQTVAKRDQIDGDRFTLADGAWLLVRFSNTEPLLRLYAEGHSPEQVTALLAEAEKLAQG